jgi:hypothetical protein
VRRWEKQDGQDVWFWLDDDGATHAWVFRRWAGSVSPPGQDGRSHPDGPWTAVDGPVGNFETLEEAKGAAEAAANG